MNLRTMISTFVAVILVTMGVYVLATRKGVEPRHPPATKVYIGRCSWRYALITVALCFPLIFYVAWRSVFFVVILVRMLLGLGSSGDFLFNREYIVMIAVSSIPIVFTLTRWLYRKLRWTTVDDGIHCLKCGYDLTGNVSGMCPECGTEVPPP